MRQISKKRAALMLQRRKMMEEKFGPRPWRCQFWDYANPWMTEFSFPACFGEVNGHELVKRSQGGSIIDPANVVPLCNGHNGWIEDKPDTARWMGLVIR